MSTSVSHASVVPGRPESVWADPVVRLCAAVSLVSVVWFALVAIHPIEPTALGWALSPVSSALAALVCWRSGGAQSGATRLFWRRAGFALAVFTLGVASHAVDSVHADLSAATRLSMTTSVLYSLGVGLFLWPLFRLPLGLRSRSQRTALWLDIGTVMAAVAIFLWHFSGDALVATPGQSTAAAATGIVLVVAGLTSILVVAKVAMTGTATLQRPALRMLGGALAIGGLGSTLTGFLADRPYLDPSLLTVPIAVGMIAVAARRQVTAAALRTSSTTRPRRRYSLLPYVAVAATDALVLVSIAQDAADRLLIAAVAVGLTALVAVRQVTAFRENDTLFHRLDAGLLELRGHERRFRSLVQNATDVVSISAPDGTLTYVSPAVRGALGIEPEVLLHHDLTPLLHPDDLSVVAEHITGISAEPGSTTTYQVRMAHADGTWRWFEVTSANLFDEPSVAGIVSNSRDITETRKAQERLGYEATHDVLTGLANRALFGERLAGHLSHTRADQRMHLILVDLDDFKTVNDTLGHAVGDALLVAVADQMRASVRPEDTVARLGGDEFAILLDGLDPDAVDRLIVRIADALREPVLAEHHLLSVRASFGVVEGGSGDDAGNLLRQADIAMYEAKGRGDGGFQRYEPGMEARGAERSRMTTELHTALEENQLVLHYQPVVTLPEGRFTGVEALVRWQHPVHGLLPPGDFIPAAELSGLIVPLGHWVLREACRQAAEWIKMYGEHGPATVAVNASALQLQELAFAAEVAGALRDSGLPPHRLIIEITESTAVGGGATHETLRMLRAMGVRLSLDDFGTGQSTLSLLANISVDQIKLDRSFAPEPGADAIAAAVIQLARALGVEVVAEGVETPAQAERLQSLGYERAQGFLFAQPMIPGDIDAALAAVSRNAQPVG
jgi:diguanylate cyclase (GGDEF)-like protein/PAS domain S-box-containing protein